MSVASMCRHLPMASRHSTGMLHTLIALSRALTYNKRKQADRFIRRGTYLGQQQQQNRVLLLPRVKHMWEDLILFIPSTNPLTNYVSHVM